MYASRLGRFALFSFEKERFVTIFILYEYNRRGFNSTILIAHLIVTGLIL